MKRDSVVTPWGMSDGRTEFGNGIVLYSTSSHGGFWLSKKMADEFYGNPYFAGFQGNETNRQWFEEDCDATAVIVRFADRFDDYAVWSAVRAVGMHAKWDAEMGRSRHWQKISEWLIQHPEGKAVADRARRWQAANADMWERGGMGSTGPGYPSRVWDVTFYRVGGVTDSNGRGDYIHVLIDGYPKKNLYSREEIEELRYKEPELAGV